MPLKNPQTRKSPRLVRGRFADAQTSAHSVRVCPPVLPHFKVAFDIDILCSVAVMQCVVAMVVLTLAPVLQWPISCLSNLIIHRRPSPPPSHDVVLRIAPEPSRSHWGRGPLETGGNMPGTLKGQDLFTCHVTTNPRSVTFHMYLPMFLNLSLTNNQSSHLYPSLNVDRKSVV